MSRNERRQGFTLLELLVVLAVIGLLAGLIAPAVFRHLSDASVSAARTQIQMLGLALDAYRLDNATYPSSAQGLAALIAPPAIEPLPLNWRGPYLRGAVPMDPWRRAYTYRGPEETGDGYFVLSSYGRDGELGGAGEDGDIVSPQTPGMKP